MKRRQASSALLLAIGAAYLGAGWDGVVAVLLFPAVALAAYGLVVLGVRYRLPAVVAAPAVVTIAAVSLIVAAASRTHTDLLSTARDLVPRLLSHPFPAPATPNLLAPGAMLVAVVGAACAIRVVRPRGGRFAPLLAVSTLYLSMAVLSGGRADPYGLVGGVLLAAVAAGWLLDEVTRPPGTEQPGEPSGQAAAALRLGVARSLPILGLVVAAALITASLPIGDPFEPRRVVDRPTQLLAEGNPLPRMAAWARGGVGVLMRVRAEQPPRLRLVALADYTGDGWQTGGSYTRLGTGVLDPTDAALPPGQRRTTVDVEVTLVIGLGGHWLPTPGATSSTSMTDVLVQPAAGALARLETSPAGFRYRVRADVDAPTPADLAGATVPRDDVVTRYLELPRLPAPLRELAGQTVQGAGTDYDRAVRIEEAVRGGRTLDPAAPTGSSYARLAAFLAPGGEGTSEQFASAFAVLARAAGLPTRVVVGFLPVDRDEQGYWEVRGRDAVAWPEVYFADLGWVPFDPRPGARTPRRS